MTMIDMKGIDTEKVADRGIYLSLRDDLASVQRGGNAIHTGKLRGWDVGNPFRQAPKSTADAIRLAGLDWEVTTVPALAHINPDAGDDAPMLTSGSPRHQAIIRTDTNTVLGFTGRRFTPVQNAETFAFADYLMADGKLGYIGGGERDGGASVWLLGRLDVEVFPGGDEAERCTGLLFLNNGHDGGSSISATVGMFRQACTNGMTIPVGKTARTWRSAHTTNVRARMEQAHMVLGLAQDYARGFREVADRMLARKVSRTEFSAFLPTLIPTPDGTGAGKRAMLHADRMRDRIAATYHQDDDLANVRGTAWGVYNAVVDVMDWQRNRQSGQARLDGAFANDRVKARAFDLLMA